MRERNVAVSRHFDHVLLRLYPEQRLQHGNKFTHRHRRCVTEIVNSQLRGAALLPYDAAGALLRRVEGTEAALDDVVDVSEVTRDFSLVMRLVHVNGLSLENGLSEEKVSP
ncbi:hypothetical protein JHK87_020934 [Glycine soja]|nr:hypothetical protein JHK87_020934 [Glycine soja]